MSQNNHKLYLTLSVILFISIAFISINDPKNEITDTTTYMTTFIIGFLNLIFASFLCGETIENNSQN